MVSPWAVGDGVPRDPLRGTKPWKPIRAESLAAPQHGDGEGGGDEDGDGGQGREWG